MAEAIIIAAVVSAAVSAATYTVTYMLTPKAKPVEQGRMQGNVQVQDSSYGGMIPIIGGGEGIDPNDFGNGFRTAGNVVYMGDINERSSTTGGGGKGGGGRGSQPVTTTITYDVDLAIMFGEGELELLALYADSELIFDNRRTAITGGTGLIDPTVLPDPDYSNTLPPDPYSEIIKVSPITRSNLQLIEDGDGVGGGTINAGGYATMRWYSGTETQPPDPIIEAHWGAGQAPAYLGRAYLMLANFNISRYGRVPNFTAVVRNKNLRTAKALLDHLAARSGADTTTEVDTTALASKYIRGCGIFQRTSLKAWSIEQLSNVVPFDWTQKNGKLTTVARTATPAYTVPKEHIGFAQGEGADAAGGDAGKVAPRVKSKIKLSETELPRRVEVKAFDPSRGQGYELNSAAAWREIVKSKASRTLELNFTMTEAEMREAAQRHMDVAYMEEREQLQLTVPHHYGVLVPTDVLDVSDGLTQYIMRVSEITGGIPGPLQLTGVPVDAAHYILQAPEPVPVSTVPINYPPTLIGTFIDSAYLRDRDAYAGQMGFYVGCADFGNGDGRAGIMYRDLGAGYERVIDLPERATMGRAVTQLAATTTGNETLTVDLFGNATLVSYTAQEQAAGKGWVYSGNECFQYTTATPVPGYPNRWTLSGIIVGKRGSKGSPAGKATHTIGERFVVLDTTLRFLPVEMALRNVPVPYKFVPSGMDVTDVGAIYFTWTGSRLRPAPPTGKTPKALGNRVTFEWASVAEENRTAYKYEVYSDLALTTKLAAGDQTFYTAELGSAQTYTIYVVAVSAKAEELRSDPVTLTYSLAVLPDVDQATMTFVQEADESVLGWTEISDPLKRVLGYNIYNAANARIGFAEKPPFRYRPTTAATTLRVKAIDAVGNLSANFASKTLTINAPAQPAALAAPGYDGERLRWKVAVPTAPGIVGVRVKDNAGTPATIASLVGYEWEEAITAGTSQYDRNFYYVDFLGQESAARLAQFTVPVPNVPATFTLSHELETIVHNLTAPAVLPGGLEYEFARANDGTQSLGLRKDFTLRERGYPVTSRSIVRYARSKNIAGRTSAWLACTPYSVPVPGAPTLTKDTTNSFNNFLKVQVSCADRSVVRSTIIQVRAFGAGTWPSTAEGTAGTFRKAGAPATVDVDWAVGGTMEFRIAHEDEFSEALGDRQWSAVTSHTFPKFNDGAIDPSSNFLKKAAYLSPIWSGGGLIEWTAAGLVKWSQPIIISGVGTLVSSNGTVTIPANTGGTALAAGQALVAVQTLGATTATLSVVTLSGYQEPDATSTTVHRRLFARNADNSLSTYLGQTMALGRIMDSRVLIPMFTSFDADFYNLQVANANIRELAATKIMTDALYGRIVFADKIGSTHFVAHGSTAPQTEPLEVDAAFAATRAVFHGDATLTFDALANGGDYYTNFVDALGNSVSIRQFPANNVVAIYQNGVHQKNVSSYFAQNIRIKIEGGYVRVYTDFNGGYTYAPNTLQHQSPHPLRYPYTVTGLNPAYVNNATLYGVLCPPTGRKIRWQSIVQQSFDAADDLTATAAAAGWGTSGASSVDMLGVGEDGSITVTAAAVNKDVLFGFSTVDTDTHYNTIERAVGFGSNGYFYVWESGVNRYDGSLGTPSTYKTGITPYAAGAKASVSREGGFWCYRLDGQLIWKSPVADLRAVRVDTALAVVGAKIMTARLHRAGALAQGWQAAHNGNIETAGDLIVDGQHIGEAQARALDGASPTLQWRGNDYGFPLIHKVFFGGAVTLSSWTPPEFGQPYTNGRVQLAVVLPAPGVDDYANFDSVRRVRVRVLNKFYEQVAWPAEHKMAGGGGLLEIIEHSFKYAHPVDEAIYELMFENVYGWSQPIYYTQGAKSLALPAAPLRVNCPTELIAGEDEDAEIYLSWTPAPTPGGAAVQTLHYREIGTTSWYQHNGLAFTTTSNNNQTERLNGTRLYPGRYYELRVANPNVAGAFSNIVQRRMSRLNLTPSYNRVGILPARATSPTSVVLNWIITDGTATGFSVYRDGALVNGTQLPAGTTTYTDATATVGATHTYTVIAHYIVGGAPKSSGYSLPTTLQMPGTANPTDPTKLTPTVVSQTRIDHKWLLNGNTGAVTLEWKVDDGTYTSNWTAIALTAGTDVYSWTLGSAGVTYAFRVKAGTSNYTNIAIAATQANIPAKGGSGKL